MTPHRAQLLEITHSGVWEERDGKVVCGPGMKEARKSDWCWRAVMHGKSGLSGVFLRVYVRMSTKSICRSVCS